VNEIYSIISIVAAGSLLFVFGLLFLLLIVPDRPLLYNYRIARRTMAFSYLFFAVVEILKGAYTYTHVSGSNIMLIQTVILSIAFSQALLFSYSLIVLVNVRFADRRLFNRELIPVLSLIAVLFIAYIACPRLCFRFLFYVFILLYSAQLVRYTHLFLTNYRIFRFRLDNYYSESESKRLHWIVFSFFASLVIGVMAMFTALSGVLLAALIFSIIVIVFYTFFAISFFNYPYLFQRIIEQSMNDDDEPEEPVQPKNDSKPFNEAFAQLEKRIELWIADKGFTEQGITIDIMSAKLITNQKYLSTYINTYKKQTFREWINELRIEEAKILLLQYPEMPLKEVASQVGFSDKSHFLRQFKKLTNVSPTIWKNIVHAQSFPVLTPKRP